MGVCRTSSTGTDETEHNQMEATMAHEVETMAYANQVPWHGLGARVDGDIGIDDMLFAAGLDWELKRIPLQTCAGDDIPEDMQNLFIHERAAWIRNTDKKVMAIAGPSWRPLQPRDTIDFMRDYVESGNATLETAGSLRDGKVVWGLARLKHDFEVRRGDRVNGYLLITSPNEVGKAISIRTTTVRVVCANTMAMAHGSSTADYTQNHVSDWNEAAAKEAVGNAHEQLLQAERNAKTLAKLKISASDAVVKALVPVFYPALDMEDKEVVAQVQMPETMPLKIQQILESVENSPGSDKSRGTGWNVLNGVTHWADHSYGRNAATRMHRAWMGDNSRHKLAVEKKLLELAG